MRNCDHDKRFSGVFFATNGCVACELEKTMEQLNQLAHALAVLGHLRIIEEDIPPPDLNREEYEKMVSAFDLAREIIAAREADE